MNTTFKLVPPIRGLKCFEVKGLLPFFQKQYSKIFIEYKNLRRESRQISSKLCRLK